MRYYGIDAELEQHFRYNMEWDNKFYNVYLVRVEEHTWRFDENEFSFRANRLKPNEVPVHTRWYVDDIVEETSSTDVFLTFETPLSSIQNIQELVKQTIEDNRHVASYKTKWNATGTYEISKDGMEEYEWNSSHNDNFDDQSIHFDSIDIRQIMNRNLN